MNLQTLTPGYVCSRYAAPTPAERRLNVAISKAIRRWALGALKVDAYSPLAGAPWQTEEQPDKRAEILRDCVRRAHHVGSAGGCLLIPSWQAQAPSSGMRMEIQAFRLARKALKAVADSLGETWPGGGIYLVEMTEILGYLPAWARKQLLKEK